MVDNGDQRDRVAELLLEARKLDADRRRAFLDDACREDEALRAEVESLLGQDAQAPRVLGELGRTESSADRDTASRPEPIGPYRLLEKIGEGGMGEVWLAEQTEPVRRRVALKIIKRGMDTRQVVARFEAERQALAMMDHPCIARVFDAGETPRGRPYFVMENVAGVPITEHSDRQRLTNRERLELFVQVCEGVQHAHQKAVIHRDLKPSNVLVTIQDGKAVPKIIDFGVAKATAQKLTERTVYTELGVLIGTPEYMSPEQAEMTEQNVDTRTDVYSLGVLLYELLVGALPFDSKELRQAGLDEVRRRIREEEPPRPSTRLTSLGDRSTQSARCRRVDLPTLQRQLRGDLDWITMKALDKDRTRRYASPSEMGADIRRHLEDEPVLAGPPSAAYRASKFARRHRVGVGIAVALFVVLLGFSITVGVLLGRTSRERDRANREAETAQAASEFLVGLFELSDPEKSGAEAATTTAREILDRGVERIRDELADQPLVRIRLLRTMGQAYRSLSLDDDARPLFEEAVALAEAHLGAEHPTVADVLYDLGDTLRSFSPDESVRVHERALAIREASLGPADPAVADSLRTLAWISRRRDLERAGSLVDRAIAIYEKAHGPEHPSLAPALNVKAALTNNAGDFEGGRRLWERALAIAERAYGPDHLLVATYTRNLAKSCNNLGDFRASLELYRRMLAQYETMYGPDHPEVADGRVFVARVQENLGDYEASRIATDRALGIQERYHGPDSPRILYALKHHAKSLMLCGDHERARGLYERFVRIASEAFGPESRTAATGLTELGTLLVATGSLESARPLLEKAYAIADRHREESYWGDRLELLVPLAELEAASGHLDKAVSLFTEASSLVDRHRPDYFGGWPVWAGLAGLEKQRDRFEESQGLYERALGLIEKTHGPDHPYAAAILCDRADLLHRHGQHDAAQEDYERAIAICADRLGSGHPMLADCLEGYGALLRDIGRREEAREIATRAREVRIGPPGCRVD